MTKIRIKQLRSRIGCTKKQVRTLEALGLKRINHEVEHTTSPQLLGMIKKVHHLVVTQEI